MLNNLLITPNLAVRRAVSSSIRLRHAQLRYSGRWHDFSIDSEKATTAFHFSFFFN